YHDEADHQQYRHQSERRAGVVSGGDVSAQRSQQEKAADEVGKEKLPMGNGGAIYDSFTLGQYGINVGTHGLPHWRRAAIAYTDARSLYLFIVGSSASMSTSISLSHSRNDPRAISRASH